MAEFEVTVEEVSSVEDHPNADRLTINRIRGYDCVSAKLEDGSPRYGVGDRVVYVPEGAVVPEWLLRKGFWDEAHGKGFLAGSKGDRVKAVKLRGVLSRGILFSVDRFEGYDPERHFCLVDWVMQRERERIPFVPEDWYVPRVGDDVAEMLGIVKYEPPIPPSMDGEACPIGIENAFHFDVESLNKYEQVLEGHEVVLEEKVHGTFMVAGYDPDLPPGHERDDDVIDRHWFVSSKSLFSKGIVLRSSAENLERNVYLRAFVKHGLQRRLERVSIEQNDGRAVYLVGEVYGRGIQDLSYSTDLGYVCFGVRFREADGTLRWLDVDEKYAVLDGIGIPRPPVLWRGTFDIPTILEYNHGRSVVDPATMREGVVITPVHEFEDRYLGRAILKSVSEEYLLRKGNATEYS